MQFHEIVLNKTAHQIIAVLNEKHKEQFAKTNIEFLHKIKTKILVIVSVMLPTIRQEIKRYPHTCKIIK